MFANLFEDKKPQEIEMPADGISIDLRTIQEWLGHRSIEMTVRYIFQRRFNGLWG